MDLDSVFTGHFFDSLMRLLPKSPFRPYIEQFAALPYLDYLNWFFPVSECLVVGGAWLTAIAVFYMYQVVMRWIKLIGD